MEAASVPATRSAAPGQAVRNFFSKYGLIIVLLAMPVWFAIDDITSDTENLSRLGNNLVDGLSNGAIWALVAIGYTLVYGIVELINFAHGEVFMIGSFVAAGFFTTIGLTQDTGTILLVLGLLITLPVAMLGSGFLNAMIERVA
jgi:branched-chain amino acid transport system permease protein